MKNVISVPENVNYLSEWEGFELPNGIFNKGTTSCGATTLALKDKFKTVICSPRNELLKNKHEQHPETLLVIGGCNEQTIIDFIRNNQTPKILVSYDSFPKVARCIEDNSDWKIIVDEFQYMLSDSGMKSPVELRFMETLKDFPYVTYMSATPIIEKYIGKISWFKGMDYTELVWSNVEKIKLIRQEAKRPIDAAVDIVRMYQSGNFPFLEIDGNKEESKECVIYLNSVNNIVNIIKQTGLKPDEVNIIVGGNQDNDKEIAKIGKGFIRGRIPLKGEHHKMFTFCTSTAFAGCDFYSTCASSFVISDSKRIQTSVDIATDLVQIAGRQRLSENPFRKILTFVYRCNDIRLTATEFTEKMEKKKRLTELEIEDYNRITDTDYKKKKINDVYRLNKMLGYGESFIIFDEVQDKFIFDEMAYVSEYYFYDLQRHNYINGITVRSQIDKKTFDLSSGIDERVYEEQLITTIKKESFADMMKRYCDYKTGENKFDIVAEMIASNHPDIKAYYDELGADRIKALGYKESSLKNEIKNRQETGHLILEFKRIFKSGMRLTSEEIKKYMAQVYANFGIKRNAVATHLEKEYGIKCKRIKISDNGSRVSGWEFL